MKRILLFVVSISMVGILIAQEDTWDIFLQGQAVKSFELEGNNIWVATDSSFLVRVNKLDKSATYYKYPFINVNRSSLNLKIDKNGVKWIAHSKYLPEGNSIYKSFYSSIYCFDGNRWEKVKSLGYGEISTLAIDKNNSKWIAGGANGLYKIEEDSCVKFTSENSGLVYNYVDQVTSDRDGNIWLSNYGNLGGLLLADVSLMKYDGDNWISFFYGRDTWLNRLIFDSQGNLWVHNFLSIRKLDTLSKSYSEIITLNPDPFFILLAIEGDNRFWFSNRYNARKNGVAVYDGLDWSFYTSSNSGLPSDTVYQIAIDSSGTKWIGTANGLAAFKENGLHTSVCPDSKKMNKITLFPNPAHDFVVLKMDGEIQNLEVDILNIQGQTIKTFSTGSNQCQLDVSNLYPGVYLVRIQSQQNNILKKLIKQ